MKIAKTKKREIVLLRVETWMKNNLKARAIKQGISTNEVICRILTRYVNKNKLEDILNVK